MVSPTAGSSSTAVMRPVKTIGDEAICWMADGPVQALAGLGAHTRAATTPPRSTTANDPRVPKAVLFIRLSNAEAGAKVAVVPPVMAWVNT